MTAGKSAKAKPTSEAAPTLKDAMDILRAMDFSEVEGQNVGFLAEQRIGALRIIYQVNKSLEASAPPAAERIALKELRENVEMLPTYGIGPLFDDPTCYQIKGGNHIERDAVLREIDAALASEGTKSE